MEPTPDRSQLRVEDLSPELRAQVYRAERERRVPKPIRDNEDRRDAARAAGRDVVTEDPSRQRRRPIKMQREDEALIPVVLRHWRAVHGLTQAQASERIGYSPKAGTWGKWESGEQRPPYRALLLVLGATGMGIWHDDITSTLAPDLRLPALRNQHQDMMKIRRRRRNR